MERAATRDETAKIKALLGEAVDAGAFGFSSTLLNQHMGYGGRPLACRNASREELKAYCNALREPRQGRDRDRDDAPDRRARGPGARAARFHARAERPAGDLHRAVRPRRHPRGGARDAAQGRADDRARRAAADFASAADARVQHAQPVLLRRLPVVQARVRGQVEGGAGGGVPRPGVPRAVQKGPRAADDLEQLGAHHAARGEEPGAETPRGPHRGGAGGGAGQGRGRRVSWTSRWKTIWTTNSPCSRSTRASTAWPSC